MGTTRAARLMCVVVLSGLVLAGCDAGQRLGSGAAKAPRPDPSPSISPDAPGVNALRVGVGRRGHDNTGRITARIGSGGISVRDELTYSLDPPRLTGFRQMTGPQGSIFVHFRMIGDRAWFLMRWTGDQRLSSLLPQCWIRDSDAEELAGQVGVSPQVFYSQYPAALGIAFRGEAHERATDGSGELIGTVDLADIAFMLYVPGATRTRMQVRPGDERVAARFGLVAGTLTRMEVGLRDVEEALGDDTDAFPLLTVGGGLKGAIVVTFDRAPARIRVEPPPKDQVQQAPSNITGVVPVASVDSCANPPP